MSSKQEIILADLALPVSAVVLFIIAISLNCIILNVPCTSTENEDETKLKNVRKQGWRRLFRISSHNLAPSNDPEAV